MIDRDLTKDMRNGKQNRKDRDNAGKRNLQHNDLTALTEILR